jgi:hypothetical protein
LVNCSISSALSTISIIVSAKRAVHTPEMDTGSGCHLNLLRTPTVALRADRRIHPSPLDFWNDCWPEALARDSLRRRTKPSYRWPASRTETGTLSATPADTRAVTGRGSATDTPSATPPDPRRAASRWSIVQRPVIECRPRGVALLLGRRLLEEVLGVVRVPW